MNVVYVCMCMCSGKERGQDFVMWYDVEKQIRVSVFLQI